MEKIIDFSVYIYIAKAFYYFWWAFLPFLLYPVFIYLWKDYVSGVWAGSLSWTVIELFPPKDLEKGPKPMESIYHGLIGVVVQFTTFEEYLAGMFTDKFSFELAGMDGTVHFYIRVQKRYRSMLEAQIYGQYPDIEIREVPDYVENFPKVVPNKDWNLWGSDLGLVKADPYPIRTYDKFEEDITGTMIDPLASFVEIMGNLAPGQNMFLQMILTPLSETWRNDEVKLVQELAKRANGEKKSILGDLVEVFANLFKALWGPVEFAKASKKEQQPLEFILTPVEKDVLKAVEENLGKNAFKVKMRFMYFGKREGFDMANVTAFFGALRQFNDLNLNNLKPDNLSKTTAHYVNIDSRVGAMKRRLYNRYRKRNTDGKTFVFSTSELATVYHFPDMGVKTPAITRVESKRGSAPPNLPIG